MGRNRLPYYEMRDFRGGINQEPENARPNQLLDARNVWCPNGRLEQRPGYRGVYKVRRNPQFYSFNSNDLAYAYESGVVAGNGAGTFSAVGSGNVTITSPAPTIGDRVYYGDDSLDSYDSPIQLNAAVVANSNFTKIKLEYWNGDRWVYLPSKICGFTEGSGITYDHYGEVSFGDYNFVTTAATERNFIHFVKPKDLGLLNDGDDPLFDAVEASIDTTPRYWYRFTLLENAPTDGVRVSPKSDSNFSGNQVVDTIGAAAFTFHNGQRKYVFVNRQFDSNGVTAGLTLESTTSLENHSGLTQYVFNDTNEWRGRWASRTRPTFAAFSDYDEYYIGYNHQIFIGKLNEVVQAGANEVATVYPGTKSGSTDEVLYPFPEVETDAAIVGTVAGRKGPYNPAVIATDSSYPTASLIAAFDGLLWAADIEGEPSKIQWSGPLAARKVWPSSQAEFLLDDDNSPITALSVWNEQLVVFKRNSIWRMVFKDDKGGIAIYSPLKDVSSIGTRAGGAVVQIPEGLAFVDEGGIFAYNGTPTPKKLSDSIDPFFDRISSTAVDRAAAVNWTDKQCALFAVPIDGSDINNAILVYDYKHRVQDEAGQNVGSWWLWEDIEAQSFIKEDLENGQEVIFFVDAKGNTYQLDHGNTNHGEAISSYVQTHRLGYKDYVQKQARYCYVDFTNDVDNITVEVAREDEDTADATSGSLSTAANNSNSTHFSTGTFTFGSTKFRSRKREERRFDFRELGRWFTVKVSNSTKNQKMKLNALSLAYVPKGRR